MSLNQTPLSSRHERLGARTHPFAGWVMPMQYEGVIAEHLAVRGSCGVFDVSHMGQIDVSADAGSVLDALLTNDLGRLGVWEGQYTLMLDEHAGIVDDLIAYRLADRWLLVVNAANVTAVVGRLRARHGPEAVRDRTGLRAMLAVQGPAWKGSLGPLTTAGALERLPYFGIREVLVAGVECLVARTGYTGEPGVEIMCDAEHAGRLWDALVSGPAPPVPCGLAARDTLRLEMGYPLHGNEISLDRTPVEAGLLWACDSSGEFVGAGALRARQAQGPSQRLVMLRMTAGGIPRAGCPVLDANRTVGVVTSGTHSPSLRTGIAMAYVSADLAAPDTLLSVDVRGRRWGAQVARRPLVDSDPRTE